MLKRWDNLPEYMRTDAVRPYYDGLKKKTIGLILKRWFDFSVAVLMMIILMPAMIGIAIGIGIDSKGGVFFLQERVTQYGRRFKILKFRTMIANNEKKGNPVTVQGDLRITKIGKILRKYRLDELPQLINIILGDMSFCGTRPEIPCFVQAYSQEMMATLLLPAGVTSEASIQYKDEERLLKSTRNVKDVYINKILPEKMKYNLESLKNYSFIKEIGIMIRTILAVIR
ncbi:MAG: sugar transferase [Lachnospiraceae bacterium]|nr:sugar transferase [Lachnospiraceae bacterium]